MSVAMMMPCQVGRKMQTETRTERSALILQTEQRKATRKAAEAANGKFSCVLGLLRT